MKSGKQFYAALLGVATWISAPLVRADQPPAPAKHTECVVGDFCLCVSNDLKSAIDRKASGFRAAIHRAHEQKQLAIYLSVPLSGSAGAFFALNREAANDVSDRITQRFGASSAWVLNPATPDADLPKGATQADYLFLWSQVLYLAEQAHDGVDLVYFAGPSDFARYLRLTGSDDLGFLTRYFDHRRTIDSEFAKAIEDKKIALSDFLSYYGFRASVSFSVGAHDEWNLVTLMNRERRASGGIIRQLPVLFDGVAVAPPLYDAAVPTGNVGKCP